MKDLISIFFVLQSVRILAQNINEITAIGSKSGLNTILDGYDWSFLLQAILAIARDWSCAKNGNRHVPGYYRRGRKEIVQITFSTFNPLRVNKKKKP